METHEKVSESIFVGGLLAIVGGFLDVYTYTTRGGIFANAQTGNIVFLGMNFAEGNLKKAIGYLIPILAFAMGTIIAEMIRKKYNDNKKVHWRQVILFLEMVILICISITPTTHNLLVNATISFVCSLQVQSFRKVDGAPYATTMCTGNLRCGTQALYNYISNKENRDKKELIKSVKYLVIILFFIAGVYMGNFITKLWGIKSILFGSLIIGITMLYIEIVVYRRN